MAAANQPSPSRERSVIDWSVAERVARRLIADEPVDRTAAGRKMIADFDRLVPEAEALVWAQTGWNPPASPARARVVDRVDWVKANIASFRRLLRPLTSRFDGQLSGPAGWVTPKIAGAELGMILGWMSGRVLGQYDMLVLEDEDVADQDVVYFVGPNLAKLEARHQFDPEQFRLWIALHELTHRAQFTAVPHLRPRFLELVERSVASTEPDPQMFFEMIGRIAGAIRAGRNPLSEGIGSLLATPDQQVVMGEIGGMMSLLEGHGDVVMDRAAMARVPDAGRFGDTLRARREQTGLTKVAGQLLGLEAKLRQYADGERFIEMIEARHGWVGVEAAFGSLEALPTLGEIRDPDLWATRVLGASGPTSQGGRVARGGRTRGSG